MGFAHLHVHTGFSRDGLCSVDELVSHVADRGMLMCAITDHGVMSGAVAFYRAAKRAGIKPILGVEAYLRDDAIEAGWEPTAHLGYSHLTLLAEDLEGYRNLVALCSRSWLEEDDEAPMIRLEWLANASAGIVCLSGCLSGEIPRLVRSGREEEARRRIAEYREIFGDRFYLEIQNHGIAGQGEINDWLVETGGSLGVKWAATQDVHYLSRDDSTAHDALLCLEQGRAIKDAATVGFGSDEFYLKSVKEMTVAFQRWPGACETTLEIADRCLLDLPLGNLQPPVMATSSGPAQQELEDRVRAGLRERLPSVGPEYEDRASHELRVIDSLDFSRFFLMVHDYVFWAKSNGIEVAPGVGSAAGSLVNYALRVTDVDPIAHGLLFERLLNPERRSPTFGWTSQERIRTGWSTTSRRCSDLSEWREYLRSRKGRRVPSWRPSLSCSRCLTLRGSAS